ncbi:MAG: Spi family protease inhibitor [Bacteroidaceae bacterium]|nr:Spi family protease inhibitor [Bacteroidaceae bacterium]
MRKLLLIIAVLLSSIGMFAQPRSEEQARKIASEFFGKKPQRKAPMLSVVPQQKVSQTIRKKVASAKNALATQTSSCYVINDEANNRFVIVSADERLYEVLGYSDNGCFDAEEAPDGLFFMLDEYNRQYDLVNALGSTQVAYKAPDYAIPIAPLLSTKWGQGDKYCNTYWMQCPQYNGDNCLSGCVATAMAQVMAYHKYPDSGMGGSVSYTTSKGIYQYMNFDSQHFDWSKMRDTYDYYH